MPIHSRICELAELHPLRALYREEMNCQVIHDSIHPRPGWTREYALELDGALIGYGSLAIDGPWRDTPTLYEFFVQREHRARTFDLFEALLAASNAKAIETQTNARLLPAMLHTFTKNIRAEAILFEAGFPTALAPPGAAFRPTTPEDEAELREKNLDAGQGIYAVTMNGELAASGGILYHYNLPYGDIFMAVAEPFRRRGLGAYLVQELKSVLRAKGGIPAARCNVDNVASRKTLQSAGMVPCGNLVSGELP